MTSQQHAPRERERERVRETEKWEGGRRRVGEWDREEAIDFNSKIPSMHISSWSTQTPLPLPPYLHKNEHLQSVRCRKTDHFYDSRQGASPLPIDSNFESPVLKYKAATATWCRNCFTWKAVFTWLFRPQRCWQDNHCCCLEKMPQVRCFQTQSWPKKSLNTPPQSLWRFERFLYDWNSNDWMQGGEEKDHLMRVFFTKKSLFISITRREKKSNKKSGFSVGKKNFLRKDP